MSQVVAGVDSSTQSCTVALYDSQTGAELGWGAAPHPVTSPPVSEQHPEDWWTALRAALHTATQRHQVPAEQIRAISVAAQYHGLVALDSQQQVLRPAKLWNDTTTTPQAQRLVAARPPGWWAEQVGSTLTAAFTITKLAWLAEHEPDLIPRIGTLLVPHDWLTLRLTGRTVTDRVDASGTGYYDAAHDRWLTDALHLAAPSREWTSCLPTVLGPEEPAGTASTAWAAQLGLRPDTMVACGTGDQAAAALALGAAAGTAVVSLGTSGTVITRSDTPVHDPLGLLNVTADAQGGFQPIAVLLNAAKVTDTFARLLGVDHDGLSDLALAADPLDLRRPMLVAYLDGERTPDRPNARGLLAGLDSATSREALALAAYEGVTLGIRAGVDSLKRIGAPVHGPVVITGGGSRSPAYRQVMADILQTEIAIVEGDGRFDVTRGAAMQAAAVLTGRSLADIKSEWKRDRRVVCAPRPGTAATHAVLVERYRTASEITSLDGVFQAPSPHRGT